jgi:hypothetical protein
MPKVDAWIMVGDKRFIVRDGEVLVPDPPREGPVSAVRYFHAEEKWRPVDESDFQELQRALEGLERRE